MNSKDIKDLAEKALDSLEEDFFERKGMDLTSMEIAVYRYRELLLEKLEATKDQAREK